VLCSVLTCAVAGTSPAATPCRITVKSLSERTDLAALSADIVDKCKLIHPSKVGVCVCACL
jgi:hypothetical protein